MSNDPEWPTAREWLGEPTAPAQDFAVGVVGVPLHVAAVSPGRCDLAPAALRDALRRVSVYDMEEGRDLRAVSVRDVGDLRVASLRPEEAFEPVVAALAALAKRATRR